MEIETENVENGVKTENAEENKKVRTKSEFLKRKQKRTFENLRGFGRKGIFGRGTELTSEEGNYFLKISEAIQQDFDTTEDKTILATNALGTCTPNEIKFSSNQIASRVIENLLPYADEAIFDAFLQEFSTNFRPICSDPFASHILQKLIEVAFLRAVSKRQIFVATTPFKRRREDENLGEFEFNLKTRYSEPHIKNCDEFVVKASNFLLNNLEDFIYDSYANHLIRSCLQNLAGNVVQKENKYDRSKKEFKILVVPPHWESIVVEYADRLFYWPQLPDFPYDECTSGVLQSLLLSLKLCNDSANKSFCKKLYSVLKTPENTNELPEIFSTEASIRFLEVLLKVANTKVFLKITNSIFLTRLTEISSTRSANFAVQKLFEYFEDVAGFEIAFDELSPNIESLLKIGHTGVVHSIGQACLRLKSRQAAFMKALQVALHCVEPKEKSDLFPLLVLKLKPYEVFVNDNSNFVHIHGSLILQTMLHFNKPINIINNFLSTKNDTLAAIFCTPAGSHVADAFTKSTTVGEKSREKLIRYMQGTYFDLVMSRHGSRVFEAFFNVAGDKQKEYLMRELADKSGLLSGSQTGKIISSKYQLHSFTLCPARWRAEFNSKNKVKDMFKDIVT